jgi:hypothetical protein
MKNYYNILGVREAATDQEIKKAFRGLAVQYHPDKNPDPKVEVLFKEITEAYNILSDPEKKVIYDLRRQNPFMDTASKSNTETSTTHRDPRYRGPGNANHVHKKKGNVVKKLQATLLPYVMVFCYAGILLPVLLFVDYNMPYTNINDIIIEESIYDGDEVRHAPNNFKFIFKTSSGDVIKLEDLNKLSLEKGDNIQFSKTKIFKTVMVVSDGIYRIKTGYVYKAVIFIPFILLCLSVIGVSRRKDVEMAFSLSLVSGFLLILSLFLLFTL